MTGVRWYRRFVFRVYAWAKAMRPEDSPEVFALGVTGALHALNVVAIFFLYYRISGHGVAWLTRAAPVFGVAAFPCAVAYVGYFLKQLPKLVAEFENPDEPIVGGPGMGFVVYAVVSIALVVVSIALIAPA